jgi:hypothetical protein
VAQGYKRGEMPELAEGARLEIVCSANPGTVGSNPTLSAIRINHYFLFPYLGYDCYLGEETSQT